MNIDGYTAPARKTDIYRSVRKVFCYFGALSDTFCFMGLNESSEIYFFLKILIATLLANIKHFRIKTLPGFCCNHETDW